MAVKTISAVPTFAPADNFPVSTKTGTDGADDSIAVGWEDASTVGSIDGCIDGRVDGIIDGSLDGLEDGLNEGFADGFMDGSGTTGLIDGVDEAYRYASQQASAASQLQKRSCIVMQSSTQLHSNDSSSANTGEEYCGHRTGAGDGCGAGSCGNIVGALEGVSVILGVKTFSTKSRL
jgi:hypothetical protein